MANREIKFRAWDGNNKCMWIKSKNLLDWSAWECVGMDKKHSDKLYKSIQNYPPDVTKDFEVMQYTGLKDKNGKEIWEGDIVKFGAQLGSVAEVKWLIKNAGFLVKDKWGDWQWLYDVVASTNCEIIGNIYENPDLLEAKDE